MSDTNLNWTLYEWKDVLELFPSPEHLEVKKTKTLQTVCAHLD